MFKESLVINLDSKIPLYLQLRDQIKGYITSGHAREDEQLPPVNTLAGKLGIHFETVRKAYKDLESDGFITMKRGLGTYFNFKSSNSTLDDSKPADRDFMTEAKELVRKSLKDGQYSKQIFTDFQTALEEVSQEFHGQKVIFTECSNYQTEEISQELKQFLNCSFEPNHCIDVEGVLVGDLKGFLANKNVSNGRTMIVTTGFHYDEVKKMVGQLPIDIHVLITNMSRETRQKLAAFGHETKFAFIAQIPQIGDVIIDILKAELGDVGIEYCSIGDQHRLNELLKRVEVVLAAPSVYSEVKEIVPFNLPIFSVFDSVDTMSMKLLKDRIFSK